MDAGLDSLKEKTALMFTISTRALVLKESDLASKYLPTGQPVLISGTMGTASYVLAGASEVMKESFGSAYHGWTGYVSTTSKNATIRLSSEQALLDQISSF